MIHTFGTSHSDILDPNFLWVLLFQLIGVSLVFIFGSLGIYKVLGKLRPKTNIALKITFTLIITIILMCAVGLISEQFDH